MQVLGVNLYKQIKKASHTRNQSYTCILKDSSPSKPILSSTQ